ncbi:hypothetical protein L916_16412 [Phytophthora nicotianae]|uniref:RxLR effector protein n=1 Tax=Phytophthora nicotianae TaxID=4792 RepID=W2I8V0_PHYNI|nr:hypothetical protein L916_16412 [Phytophthora nicotianae]
MYLSSTLLAVCAFALLASANTLTIDSGKSVISTIQQPDSNKFIHTSKANESKRSLRLRETDHIRDDAPDEEERTGLDRAKMLSDKTYRKQVFAQWLNNNYSSMTVFDILDVSNFEQYRRLYNKYAKLHKSSGNYP